MTVALFKIGDCVRPKTEWRDDPNRVPTGIVCRIEPWGDEGVIHIEGEQRVFVAYAFELESEREAIES